MLQWTAISFFKGSSQLRNWTCVSCISYIHRQIPYHWATWENRFIFKVPCLLLGRKVMTNLDSILKSRDITLPTKVCLVKAMVFPVVMYGCESWTVKKAEHWRIDAFELWCWRRLESPLDCKEIQPAHPKGHKSWVEAETPILWPPHVKSWLIGKVPDAGKDWRQEEQRMTEDEMVGWYHRLDGHEFE